MKPPRPIQAVLFDLDGTLIDSAPDLGAAVDKMRVDRGLSSFPLELVGSLFMNQVPESSINACCCR